MYVTKLDFKEVLESFYQQNTYDFMILFVSSFNNQDKSIIKNIVDNARRIDKITGNNICFYYFIENQYDWMNERITQIIKDYIQNNSLPPYENPLTVRGLLNRLYTDGVEITMETANDICHHFGIYKTSLPAFILVSKNRDEEPSIYSVQDYEDLESFFTPLNILHSYISDKIEINNQDEELEKIKQITTDRLNKSLNTDLGEELIKLSEQKYTYAILKIWELVITRKVRISNIIEKIQNKIDKFGFDIFISCKSQDYESAHSLYDYLKDNGFKPFIADTSIKEVGIDQYTALIGKVLDKCNRMIVFATDVNYIETSYVAAEWHAFINDINTGHKPNAKIINILSPDISPHQLPQWLRDKQSLTTENYKNDLLDFLND